MADREKARITIISRLGEEIVYFKTKKQVKKIGNGGHIVLPSELIGKDVIVEFKEENKN